MNITTILLVTGIIIFFIIPSLKDRVVPVKKIIITPAIFIYLLFDSSAKNFPANFESTSIIILGLLFGTAIVALIRNNVIIKADKDEKLIWIPGDYTSLIIFLAIFSMHFLVGYLHSVDPGFLTQESIIETILLFLLASTSGLSASNSLSLYKKYHFSKTEKLALPIKG